MRIDHALSINKHRIATIKQWSEYRYSFFKVKKALPDLLNHVRYFGQRGDLIFKCKAVYLTQQFLDAFYEIIG
ncbi:hypothetical protein CKO13_03455 [Halorhodospira neutriphila]|uniref:Uncharacterized protein n=1 Tax=Halorhodospira neutriphila TaxID=168379 RepID=A0ABS1E4E9_9GAMM|nr:hypothetical protein [Halorhodospira neutriphila]